MSLLFQNWSNNDLETTRGAYIFLIDKLMKEKNDIPRDKNYQKNFIALQNEIDRAIDLKKIIEDELSYAK